MGFFRNCLARWTAFQPGVPRLPAGGFMGLGNIREGLPVLREPALLTSAGRIRKRTSGDGARAAPNR